MTSSKENTITRKTLTELLGMHFYIPNYQRGYRWTTKNVEQLLDDIWEYRTESSNQSSFYCLQPVVVRKKEWTDIEGQTIEGFELIDGQQRLSTLHRILTYLRINHLRRDRLNEVYSDDIYSIDYQTRPETKAFLNTTEYTDSKPDLYYLSEAYKTIEQWFGNSEKINGYADQTDFLNTLLPSKTPEEKPEWSVQVIWYEIKDNDENSEKLFTRLNRGKIPLTSAELIKAKFVNEASFKSLSEEQKIKRKTQLISHWDDIENQLNQPKFWAFVSNEPIEKYSNKIEYLFNIHTQKKQSRDPLYSFLHFFDDDETADSLWKKWLEIEEIYYTLYNWYNQKNSYHKIGFLIAAGYSIFDLMSLKRKNNKDEFEEKINQLIAEQIREDWQELDYSKANQHLDIQKVLMLVNIELTRNNGNDYDFFPFELYKKMNKSIEHIHAQNIDGINENRKEEWLSWLDAHCTILIQVVNEKTKSKAEKLIQKIQSQREDITFKEFEDYSKEILNLIPDDGVDERDYLHRIENLAIVSSEVNSTLNNSVFEVKRQKIIELDRKGAFIPEATKRVFLKYYAGEDYKQSCIWTEVERSNYLKQMTECITNYKIKQEETVITNEE